MASMGDFCNMKYFSAGEKSVPKEESHDTVVDFMIQLLTKEAPVSASSRLGSMLVVHLPAITTVAM